MIPTTWFNQNKGKLVLNPEPPYGIPGQCVNAASSWSMTMGGPELRGPTAYQVWLTFRSPFFQVINGTDRQIGDIVFLAPSNPSIGTGPDGHVYVCSGDNGGYDANWSGDQTLHATTHSTTGVLGVFRKVIKEESMQPTAKQVGDTYKFMTNQDISQKDLDFYITAPRTIYDLIYALGPDTQKKVAAYGTPNGVKPYDGPALFVKE